MRKYLIITVLLCSCWSERTKPDSEFMKLIELQASLDSSQKTTIRIAPKKVNLGVINRTKKIAGSFWIKNIGDIDFNILELRSNCDCCKIEFNDSNTIKANDSLEVKYTIKIRNNDDYISQSIVVIGNCQFGNQTFLIQAFINP